MVMPAPRSNAPPKHAAALADLVGHLRLFKPTVLSAMASDRRLTEHIAGSLEAPCIHLLSDDGLLRAAPWPGDRDDPRELIDGRMAVLVASRIDEQGPLRPALAWMSERQPCAIVLAGLIVHVGALRSLSGLIDDAVWLHAHGTPEQPSRPQTDKTAGRSLIEVKPPVIAAAPAAPIPPVPYD